MEKKNELIYDQDRWSALDLAYHKIKYAEQLGIAAGIPSMRQLNQQVEVFYLLYKMRLYCRYLSYSSFLQQDKLDVTAVDFFVLQNLQEPQYALVLQTPVLYAYYLTIQLQNQDLNEVHTTTINTIFEFVYMGLFIYIYLHMYCTCISIYLSLLIQI